MSERHRAATAVALGGGHGLHAALSALRLVTDDLTAIVTVADDGGSSGRIRRELPVLPPGDLRMALAALAGDEPEHRAWAELLQHRLGGTGVLAGHPVGNLMLTGLLDTRTTDPVAALARLGALVGAVGRVLPMSPVPLDLVAEVDRFDPDDPDRTPPHPRPVVDRGHARPGALDPAAAARRAGLRGRRRRRARGRRRRARSRVVVHQRDPAPAAARARHVRWRRRRPASSSRSTSSRSPARPTTTSRTSCCACCCEHADPVGGLRDRHRDRRRRCGGRREGSCRLHAQHRGASRIVEARQRRQRGAA